MDGNAIKNILTEPGFYNQAHPIPRAPKLSPSEVEQQDGEGGTGSTASLPSDRLDEDGFPIAEPPAHEDDEQPSKPLERMGRAAQPMRLVIRHPWQTCGVNFEVPA